MCFHVPVKAYSFECHLAGIPATNSFMCQLYQYVCVYLCVCVCSLICLIACSILTLYNFDSFVILTLKFIMSGMMYSGFRKTPPPCFLYCRFLYCGDFPEFVRAVREVVLYSIDSDDWLWKNQDGVVCLEDLGLGVWISAGGKRFFFSTKHPSWLLGLLSLLFSGFQELFLWG